ncbi:unnamed protein product, partial [Prorocentrum cordatum]
AGSAGAAGPPACKSCGGSGLQYPDSVILSARASWRRSGPKTACSTAWGARIGRRRPLPGTREALRAGAAGPQAPSAPAGSDLGALAGTVTAAGRGLVELGGPLRPSTRAEPARLKAAAADKTYVIRFRVEGGFRGSFPKDAILALAGQALDQRTPSRVEHRRADLVRDRKILALGPLVSDGDEVELTIKAQSGTYIKEFVHGDEGRTVPSVAAVLGRPCRVVWLDVTEIHDED